MTEASYTPHGHLSLADRKRRLLFRAWHRGIKELDLIFGHFIEQNMDTLTDEDCVWFESLFEENDHQVLAWITGQKPVPSPFNNERMRQLQALDFMKLRAR